ncbi:MULTISPECIES: cysteine hydrolase family protein [Pseudomonadaceae]|jgi:nicotinamidase-related amidase|uniref:Isochorismatase n=1 Tax=Stutzerimonas stutzeri TaxID=316 RepID=A0A0D9AIR3_STUST|nr:cysteine hydrolase family protein [Stutzerimonas stutzeri]KJH80584.1 isochorismatase [Stutzerimonas stutzeri]
MSQPKRALIVIDVQNEYVTGNLRIEYPDVQLSLSNIARAMDAARAAGIPVVAVQHIAPETSPLFARGSQQAELHHTVAARSHDLHVEKSLASALVNTNLGAWLRDRQIDTLTVVGYMTHNCDNSTVVQAHHEGWKVELLHDATGSLPYQNSAGAASAEEIHRAFTVVMHTGFAAVASTDQWLEAVNTGQPLSPDNIYLSNQRAIQAR